MYGKKESMLLAAYQRSGLSMPLVIAGAGTRREERKLGALVADTGGKVRWVGHVNGPDKQELMEGSVFVVLPSRHETFGVAALEGMSYGKPVVHLDLPALRWMSGDVRVPPFDVGALAGEIRYLAVDEAARRELGRTAHAAAREIRADEAADCYFTLVQELLNAPSAGSQSESRPGMSVNVLTESIERGVPLIVLAPHLDDAAACGAFMIHAASAYSVTVVTLFTEAGEAPYTLSARRYLHQVGARNAQVLYQERRAEDRQPEPIGIKCVHAGLTEALFRRRPERGKRSSWRVWCLNSRTHIRSTGSTSPPAISLPLTPGRCTMCATNSEADRIRPDLVLAPLGVGGHVDHVLVRNAAERSGARVVYYSDFPYNQREPVYNEFIRCNDLVETRWSSWPRLRPSWSGLTGARCRHYSTTGTYHLSPRSSFPVRAVGTSLSGGAGNLAKVKRN